ncbi:MAG: Npt1/Npt2 family nucleotide transporter [Halioglobus sp.]
MQRFSRTERFLSLFTTLRPGEGTAALSLCIQAFVIMFAYYLLKVIREPMILADGSAELKAYSTALQAILLMLIVPVFARLYQQVSNLQEKHHLFRNTLLFFVANLALFALCYRIGIPVAIAFYVWLGIFSVMVLALFWAFAADLFNLKSGQRIFPLIAAAAAFGALLGSGLASDLDRLLGHDGVMCAAGALLCIPWWLSKKTEDTIPNGSCSFTQERGDDRPYPLLEGFQIVWRSRYLSLIAGFVIVLNLINTNGEYILATFVTDAATQGAANLSTAAIDMYITEFYSRYLFVSTLLGFLIQLFLVAKIYDRIGIAGALHILPILMIINYSVIAVLPILAVIRTAMIMENSINYSLQTTTRHALFLPVSREEKYVGKHTIDTFFFRVGDVLSGSFVYLASIVIGLSIVGFVMTNIALACVLLLVSRAIGRHHTQCVSENLGNMPPVVQAPLEDLQIPAGQMSFLELDADTFVDPDVGDALKYHAFAIHSSRLPGWVKFDSLHRRFAFDPPADEQGSLRIRVVARDFDGLEAEVNFDVNYRP